MMKNTSFKSRMIGFTALGLLSVLASCQVGPDYHAKAPALPETFVSQAADPQAEIEQDWWKHFNDTLLDKFIKDATAGNFDLKLAEARIKEARAARATAFNDLLPTVNTDASFERQSNRLAIGSVPFNLSKPFNTFQTGFDASWELDLFGGKRRALESATAELESGEASRDDARVSLLAEVARTYVDIRQYQTQIALTQATYKADEESAKIAKDRFRAGEAAGIDATQADVQLKSAAAQLPFYQSLLTQTEFSMDLLLGAEPGSTAKRITDTQPIPVEDKAVILAAPAKVIASRPDIRAAERKLASATAQQGVAVAQFFPDISLSGFLGLLSSDLGTTLHGGSKSWDMGGNLIWPILNFGKLEANKHASDAREEEAKTEYQKSVLSALIDVERAYTSYSKEEEHRARLEEAVKSNEEAVNVSQARYKEGLSSFIDVLDAQRSLYALQSQAASSRALASQDLIAVYKSLGGGWQDVKAKPPEVYGPQKP